MIMMMRRAAASVHTQSTDIPILLAQWHPRSGVSLDENLELFTGGGWVFVVATAAGAEAAAVVRLPVVSALHFVRTFYNVVLLLLTAG